jgi:hypothetical protein
VADFFPLVVKKREREETGKGEGKVRRSEKFSLQCASPKLTN